MWATRFFRISAAKIGPNRFHQNRTVSWLMSIPRSARVGGDELVDEALGVDPTERVVADAELAGVVGDDDGLAAPALGLDCAPQRRFTGDPHRIGRDPPVRLAVLADRGLIAMLARLPSAAAATTSN